ncbi:hypothetical protein SDC9_211810 [bioreactor metagenome]|uniref:Uncharacterized protein n=1 Tax=bioreactor metagenome TaxID=1076179 RepID=A0A645JMR3_9ZZZZ
MRFFHICPNGILNVRAYRAYNVIAINHRIGSIGAFESSRIYGAKLLCIGFNHKHAAPHSIKRRLLNAPNFLTECFIHLGMLL